VRRVTALTATTGDRVAVELDGSPWRVLPAEAVLAAGLADGAPLDRERARRLAQELRRLRARDAALSIVRHRDASSEGLRRRLERRGVPPAGRDTAVKRLGELGIVNDRRFASTRAAALARRGYGDEAIAADLEGEGVEAEAARAALQALPPELERLEAILERRGIGARTARYVAGRGFGADAVAAAAGVDFANDP
jgi:SOS response regulatory protein OraA/RecX